ncbi:MAG: hypothetical protein PHD29_07010 [bacterium]|nr:hypothetical protein [bacterium]MDD5756818.1 hypothetical protein [bacterium]
MAKLMSKFSLRAQMYVLIILVFVLAVFWKQNVIKGHRTEQIVSMLEEWDRLGKPVQVHRITEKTVKEYTKVSIRLAAPESGHGFVVRDVRNKLAAGQEAYAETPQGQVRGGVASVADNLDISTGMFPVRITFNGTVGKSGQSLLSYVCTTTYEKAISVPNEIVDIVGDKYYVWKIKDDMAVKTQIFVKNRNGYGSIVSSGLKPDDIVIYQGQALIKPGDRVRIMDGGDK